MEQQVQVPDINIWEQQVLAQMLAEDQEVEESLYLRNVMERNWWE